AVPAEAGQKKPQPGKKGAPAQPPKPVAPPPPRSALLTHEAWQNASMKPLQPGELDQLIAKEQQGDQIQPAPLTSDEPFIRRVTLDLTGQLPMPADVTEFVTDKDSAKRAKLIDKLLASNEYARHWAHYWRDVITARLSDRRGLALARSFEEWLAA